MSTITMSMSCKISGNFATPFPIRITHLHKKNSRAKSFSINCQKVRHAKNANEGMHPGFESQARRDVTEDRNRGISEKELCPPNMFFF